MAQNIVFKISADTSNFDAGMKKTGVEVDNVNKKTKQATAEVGQFQNALGNIAGMVAAAFSVSSIIAFANEVRKTTTQFEAFGRQLEAVTGSQEKASTEMAYLQRTSNELGLELVSTTKAFASFAGAATKSGMSMAQVRNIFSGVAKAATVMGLSAEQTEGTFLALQQMVSKGTVSMEELRQQLSERIPGAFSLAVKAAQKMTGNMELTEQQFGKMVESGQILSKDFLPALAEQFQLTFGEDSVKAADGMTAATNRLENAWTEFKLSVGESAPIKATIEILTNQLDGLTTSYEFILKLVATMRASMGDTQMLFDLAKTQAEKQTAAINSLAQTQAEATSAEIQGMKMSREAKIKFFEGEIETNQKLADQGDKYAKLRVGYLIDELLAFEKVGTKKEEVTDAELKRLEKEKSAREKAQKDIKDWLTEQAKIHLETRSGLVGPQQTREQANMGMGIDERTKKEMQSQFEEAQTNLEHAHKMGEKTEEQYLRAKLALYEKYGQDKRKVEEEIYAFEQGFAKERTKEVWTEAQSRVYATDKTLETLNMLNNAYTQSQTNQLQKQLEQGVISQEQYEQSLRKIKRRQAVIDKAGALFNIAINTAQGVSSAAGSVLGLPLAPVIGALGAIQAGIVLATPIPYNKGTKKVPMVRGAVRGKDSVHAILTPNERVVPEDINTQPGYSALMDLAHDRKISDKEAGFIAKLATGGVYAGQQSSGDIDYNQLGKSIAKYIPHTDVRIDHNGIAVITDRSHANMNRLKTRL
jgi:tape measure domain-containing protein